VHPDIVSRLFHPFATTKGRSGTGLGLYISRQIVRECDGDLTLTSRAGQGARFEVRLPVSTRPAEPVHTPPVGTPGAAQALAGLRILLVDDEELVRSPMARYLKRRGATVFEAGDGLQALELLAAEEVDVIVADLRMPRLDGAGLYARLQAEQPALADRLLFLSGDITHLAGRGLAPVPRERVMVKPVELAELEQRVRDFAAWTS
jgi:CheY-like chemotaxis protein